MVEGALQMAQKDQTAAQEELDAAAAMLHEVRSDVGGCQRQLQELQVTCNAKQHMISAAQDNWSAEAASCATRAVAADGVSPAEAGTFTLSASLKSRLRAGRLSLRRAVNEVLRF